MFFIDNFIDLTAVGALLTAFLYLVSPKSNYELRQQGDRLDIWKRSGRKTEIILQATGERVQRTTVTDEDLRRFEVLAARLQARGAA